MPAVPARTYNADAVDAARSADAAHRENDRKIIERLREQLATRTEALDRKMDLAVEAELELRKGTVAEYKKILDEQFAAHRERLQQENEELKARLARVEPLKAGDDGQDLPQSGSGEKSALLLEISDLNNRWNKLAMAEAEKERHR